MSPITAISGPHGSGKTTLVGDAMARLGVAEIERAAYPRVDSDSPFERVLRFAERYAAEFDRVAALDVRAPALVQRCNIDQFVYGDAFHACGWMSDDEHAVLRERIGPLVDMTLASYAVVLLLPPLETLRTMLSRRIERIGAKWRENDMAYLDAVHAAFAAFADGRANHPNLHVLSATDRSERIEALRRVLALRSGAAPAAEPGANA